MKYPDDELGGYDQDYDETDEMPLAFTEKFNEFFQCHTFRYFIFCRLALNKSLAKTNNNISYNVCIKAKHQCPNVTSAATITPNVSLPAKPLNLLNITTMRFQ
jgi:hypothetical protein